MRRNPNFSALKARYLFPEIGRRRRTFLAEHPCADLINLSIGDTTEPIPVAVVEAFISAAEALSRHDSYTGYGPEQGIEPLRALIASKIYGGKVAAEDIFLSDGAKCDIGRLQTLFGANVTIAVQDPAYPVYLEGSLIQGIREIIPMPCHRDNGFFPDLASLPACDLIYFCSPNNPTGATATFSQLAELVAWAEAHRSIIIYDAAYSHYIRDAALPRSIYAIPGADRVAIEVNSFSKLAGFTGVRLGWSVVPQALTYDDGTTIRDDWHRLTSTLFNGASNIAQAGGIAVLQDDGWQALHALISYYLQNTQLLKDALMAMGLEVYGGDHVPYLWVRFPGRPSWETFQIFLEKYHLVGTPGSGFGPSGDEYLRLTAFAPRERIVAAAERLSRHNGVVAE